MLASSSSRDTGDEYEDAVFMVELQGLFDHDTMEHDIDQGRCRIGLLESDQPVIQIGSNTFVGRWESTPGTDLLFREITHRQMLTFVGSSEKRLVAQRVLLNSKRKRKDDDDDDEEEDGGGQDSDKEARATELALAPEQELGQEQEQGAKETNGEVENAGEEIVDQSIVNE